MSNLGKQFNSSLQEHSVLMRMYSDDLIHGNTKNSDYYQNRLQTLNDNMVSLANKAFSEINKTETKKDSFDESIGEKRVTLMKTIESLEKERKKYNAIKDQSDSFKKEYSSTQDLVVSNKLQYRLWLTGSIFLLIVTLRHLLSK
jgi:phage shock protein A